MVNAEKIVTLLLRQHPNPKLALSFANPLELLVAVILSAQCTDARVNGVTKTLFKKYKSAAQYARAEPKKLEQEIKPTGFYRSKTKMLINCCRRLVEEFGGEVPARLEQLVTLPGVGRKTANMVLGNAFAEPGIAVDTHVLRVSNRLGLVRSDDPAEVEQLLMKQLPKGRWTVFSNALILHGREICTARKPRCGACALYPECEWSEKSR